MSISLRMIAISILLILVTACTTFREARKQFENDLPLLKRSYLVGKFSVQCKTNEEKTKCWQSFNSISAHYGAKDQEYFDRLNSTSGSAFGDDTVYDKVDYDRQEKSYYFCRILPAGTYYFYKIGYWNFAGGGSGYSLNEEDFFDVPFQLETGKISLVGHLKLTTEEGKNIFGLPLATPGVLELSPLDDDEVQLAIQKCPEAARNGELIPQVLWEKNYSSPFVKTR